MSPIEEIESLLKAVRARIGADRDSLIETSTAPDGSIEPEDAVGVAKYGQLLDRVELALSACRGELLEMELDSSRWNYILRHRSWHQKLGKDGSVERNRMVIDLPVQEDLSCTGTVKRAIDRAMEAEVLDARAMYTTPRPLTPITA